MDKQDYCVHMNNDLESYGGVKRSDLPDSAFVFPDERTFPVKTAQDVKDAVSSWGRYKGKHSFDDFKSKLKERAKSIGAGNALPQEWAQEATLETMMSSFLFVDLSQLVNGKPFDGLATGSFVDMTGKPVVIQVSDLQAYVDNTKAVIESTRTATGELVGLPIDSNNHDHAGGAGWIVGASLDTARNIVQFAVKWTDVGAQLIRDNTRRFFSPSLDPSQKVVVGGSLTNWPASRFKNGTLALRPIELSSMIEVIEDNDTKISLREMIGTLIQSFGFGRNNSVPENQSQWKENENMATIAELAKTEQGARELAALVEQNTQERVKQLMQVEKNKLHLAELSNKLVGGTSEVQRGLPFKSEELVEFLSLLSDDTQKKAEEIFGKIQSSGLVDFAQKGHGGSNDSGLKQLPAEYSLNLDSGALKLADLANPKLGLGDLAQYDLSRWSNESNTSLTPEQEKIVNNLVVQIVKGGVK